MNSKYCDVWEWEHLRRPITGRVVQVADRRGDFGVITIERDDEYGISAVIETDGKARWADDLPEGVPGTEVVGTLVVVDIGGDEIQLPDAMIGGHGYQSVHGLGRGTVHVHLNDFWIGQPGDDKPHLHIDWCVSGPDTSLIFTGMTDRETRTGYTRVRRTVDQNPANRLETATDGDLHTGHSWDWLSIRLGDRPIRLCKTPKDFGPARGKCHAIEYDCDGGGPTQEERDGIVEILGFMFGRQLLPIGTTLFDKEGGWYAAHVRNPWGNLVRSTCEWTDRPAIPMDHSVRFGVASQIQAMAAAYLSMRDQLDLSTFVWKMFIADMMPRPTGIPVLAPALEGLANKWLKSAGNSQTHYMDPKAFKVHFADEFMAMSAKAAGLPHAEAMLNKMKSAFNLSARDLFDRFFDGIGLPIGDGERAVIVHRNALAHGGTGKVEPRLSVRVQQAYRTLMTRTLLKILGHTGDYVDYTIAGWAVRHIDEPMGCTDLKTLLK